MNFSIIKFILLFLYYLSFVFALNLKLTDYHNPQANHILDAEIIGNVLIISAMVQGIELYDISNNENINHLTNFSLSSGGGWGGGSKANCVRAIENIAYFTSNNGLYIVDISNPSNPESLGSISGTNNYNLANLDVYGNVLAVCAHNDGVLLYDISNPTNPIYSSNINTNNAWSNAIKNDVIYIGDEQNILIYDINNIESPNLIGSFTATNAIKDVIINDNNLYVAIGSDGVNIYDVSSVNDPQLLDNFNTGTMANRLAVFDNKVAVSDWEDIDILEWDGISLNQVGYKNTGNRSMAIAAKNGGYIYSAEWASIQVFKYGKISGPDIDLNTWELNYPYVENGNSFSLFLEIKNNGNQILINTDNYTTNSEFYILNPLQSLAPGQSQNIEIIYNASNLNASGSYRIYSNDQDEPEIICETNGNIDGANIGELATDFNLDYVANGTGSFQLSDHLDKIIVLAFFAPN